MRKSSLYVLLFINSIACNSQKEPPGSHYYGQANEARSTVASDSSNFKQDLEKKEESIECGGENLTADLGIGIVYVDSGDSSPEDAVIKIYNDSTLKDQYVAWHYYEEERPSKAACPKYYYPDYAIFNFVCLNKTEKYYKILINYDQVKYLPRIKEYQFVTWEDYILRSFGIHRLSPRENKSIAYQPVRVKPMEQSDSIKLPTGYELLCPDEIKGDWVKVRYDCFYAKNDTYEGQPCHDYIDKCNNPLTGWLKWKEGNKVLIGIYLMP